MVQLALLFWHVGIKNFHVSAFRFLSMEASSSDVIHVSHFTQVFDLKRVPFNWNIPSSLEKWRYIAFVG